MSVNDTYEQKVAYYQSLPTMRRAGELDEEYYQTLRTQFLENAGSLSSLGPVYQSWTNSANSLENAKIDPFAKFKAAPKATTHTSSSSPVIAPPVTAPVHVPASTSSSGAGPVPDSFTSIYKTKSHATNAKDKTVRSQSIITEVTDPSDPDHGKTYLGNKGIPVRLVADKAKWVLEIKSKNYDYTPGLWKILNNDGTTGIKKLEKSSGITEDDINNAYAIFHENNIPETAGKGTNKSNYNVAWVVANATKKAKGLQGAGVYPSLSYPTRLQEQRYKVLYGEIAAGNDNHALVSEMKSLAQNLKMTSREDHQRVMRKH